VAPPNVRQNIPPIVLQWLPFAVSYAGIFISHMGFGAYAMTPGGGMGLGGGGALYFLGYSTLVFGLLARIAQPQDQIARIVIAVGSAMLVIPFFQSFDLFKGLSDLPVLLVVTYLLLFLVTLLGVLCIVFVVPPQKLPPALQAVDALGPVIAAILIVWLPVFQILVLLTFVMHGVIVGPLLAFLHGLLPIVAFFGVLMMTAPAAYEEAKSLFTKGPGGPGGPGGGYPPQGGGYPPQGGGYPQQGGGYPPAGGGYPPQQGGWQ
jgi:hypothetical protein